jgi:thioredoxin reductase (NADPH)
VNADGGVKVDHMMQTSAEGVWAIGDIRNTPFKQAVVAAGDGCIAAMAIDRYLNSRKAIKPDWAH